MSGGIVVFLIILILIAISKDQRRGKPEPWQTCVGVGCLSVALFLWIVLISTIMSAG